MRVVEYMIVEDDSGSGVTRQVMAHMKAGWKLQGGVSVTTTQSNGGTTGSWFAQAMVYELEDEDDGK